MFTRLHEYFLVILDVLQITKVFRKKEPVRAVQGHPATDGTLVCRLLGHKFIAKDSFATYKRYRAVDWCVRCGLTKGDLMR